MCGCEISKRFKVIVEQTKFYHQELSIVYQILLTISSQILGYAFAGMTRRYLVRPPGMIWPGTLMSTAMFTTMHKSENKIANGWTISRWKFFLVVWFGACAWYFVPGLLMPSLSYFNVLTWFAPNNVVVANLVSDLEMRIAAYTDLLVWGCVWSGSFSDDIRLGSNSLYWLSTPHPLVGRCKCCWRTGYCDVDSCTHYVYESILFQLAHRVHVDWDQITTTSFTPHSCPYYHLQSLMTPVNLMM